RDASDTHENRAIDMSKGFRSQLRRCMVPRAALAPLRRDGHSHSRSPPGSRMFAEIRCGHDRMGMAPFSSLVRAMARVRVRSLAWVLLSRPLSVAAAENCAETPRVSLADNCGDPPDAPIRLPICKQGRIGPRTSVQHSPK